MITSFELFAGAGGCALGLEQAGIHPVALVENNKDACNTLRLNRPSWNIIEQDISTVDFTGFTGKVDIVTGGFPCQAFSQAGKHGGFDDPRGNIFFQFVRALREVRPILFIAENVPAILTHNSGQTFQHIQKTLSDLGYDVEYSVLNSCDYSVPQNRLRVIIIGALSCSGARPQFPLPHVWKYTLKAALYAGSLYETNCPRSPGYSYSEAKKKVLDLVPPGGNWRNLSEDTQQKYMGKGFYSTGGRTGIAKRLSFDQPSPTILCSPAQKQTERCHPTETRPLTVRESARIQTFPDDWQFCGSIASQYKQIGNALPVNMARALGEAAVFYLNNVRYLYKKDYR